MDSLENYTKHPHATPVREDDVDAQLVPRVLVVTNMYPSERFPYQGTFVQQQVLGLERIGLRVEVLFLDRVAEGRRVYRSIPAKLRKCIQAFKPGLVHVMYGGVMAQKIIAAPRDKLPVVVSFCGDDLLGSPGPVNVLRNIVNRWASHVAARGAAGIIVKSRNLQNSLPADVKKRKLVCVIPNGVNLDRFRPRPKLECQQRLGWDQQTFHITHCSSGNPQLKRTWLARSAVDEVRSRGWPAQLHILDRVSHADVPYWLSASDALLVTSIQEGSVNIVKEALASNLPIVSVDVGDVAERIEGVRNCYLAEPTAEYLADKLLRVLKSGERSDGQSSVQSLTIESVAVQIRDVYQSVMKTKRTCAEFVV